MDKFTTNPQDFMAQMMNLQQQYMNGLGHLFNSAQNASDPAQTPFEEWWQHFPKSGQQDFDDFFRNLSRVGMEAMQNPLANMQQPFLPSGMPGADWFSKMNEQFESWIKAAAPSTAVFDKINEQFRSQLQLPFSLPGMENPFASFNPANQLNSSILNLLQNLFGGDEKKYGEQLLKSLEQYQQRMMEMNHLLAQVGIDSISELQKRAAEQESINMQELYEAWMEISQQVFDQKKLSEKYQQAVAQLTEAGEKLKQDFEEYRQTLTEQLGLVARAEFESMRDEIRSLKAQMAEMASSKPSAPKPSAPASNVTGDEAMDDFTVLNGIGAKFNDKLHELGIHSMNQLASMSDEMLKSLDDDLQTRGRVFQQQWREQAEQLVNTMAGKK